MVVVVVGRSGRGKWREKRERRRRGGDDKEGSGLHHHGFGYCGSAIT
jgi:hypothetical protein